MSEFFNNLYEKFLLRDMLSFITPGAILTASVLLLWLSPSQILANAAKIHWILHILIFGFLYIVGFAVQCLGAESPRVFRLPPLIRFHRDLTDNRFYNDDNLRDIYERNLSFQDRPDLSKRQNERLVILHQMCGNGFLAALIAAVLLTIKHFLSASSLLPPLATVILTAALLFSLYVGHLVHVRRRSIWQDVVLGRQKRGGVS